MVFCWVLNPIEIEAYEKANIAAAGQRRDEHIRVCYPDKPEILAQCIPIYGTVLVQCTRNRANAGPILLVCLNRTGYSLIKEQIKESWNKHWKVKKFKNVCGKEENLSMGDD